MNIGVVPNRERRRALDFTAELVKKARMRGWQVWVDGQDGADLDPQLPIDIMIASGGDGTMLRAVSLAIGADRPVLGFNLGTLGFLAAAEPNRLDHTLDLLEQKRFRLVPRMTVMAELNGMVDVGVNDVVVEKIDSQRLVELEVEVDSQPMISYRADGVVICTPTGSTAYNLSAGGPLIDPALDMLVMTPVAPHFLFSRAMVFPPHRRLRFEVMDDRSAGVGVDGREIATMRPGDWIEVEGAGHVTFAGFAARSFPASVKQKFSLA